MKKFLLIAAVGLLACAASLNAQPPMGGGFPPMGGGGFPPMGAMGGMNAAADNRTPEEKTDELVTKYNLSAEQRQALLELNMAYAGKLQMSMDTTAMRDPRSMSEEEREAFFSSMEDRMSQMMEQSQEIAGNQEAYEDALKEILGKKIYRKYNADQERERLKRQREMERQFQAGGFGGGFPPMGGGGFGGPGRF